MILTDGVHLVSDTSEEELHDFADSIGLKRRWYQKGHYDVFPKRKALALKYGAVLVTTRECVIARRQMRKRRR